MPPTKKKTQTYIDVLRASSLARIPWLAHGFSTRVGGVSKVYGGRTLNLGFTSHDSRTAVDKNRREFVSAVFANTSANRKRVGRRASFPPVANTLITVRQIHSDIIHHVSTAPNEALAGDGLITQTPGL